MQSQWNDEEAQRFADDPVALRAYSSRLLGREPSLVQHGGGNTSVKTRRTNLFGETESLLYVKGSGWDLATIEPQGFAPVKLDLLLKMARLERLSDSDMVREQKAAMIDPSAPTPSVEAILHAIIPYAYVEHTHSDAVVTLTNTPTGEDNVRQVYGERMLVVPYVMPGFILARRVFEQTRDIDWGNYDGMILLNHGIFTFHNDAKVAYENMLELVTLAERFLDGKKATNVRRSAARARPTALAMAGLRQSLGRVFGGPVLVRLDGTEEAVGFSSWDAAAQVAGRGTVTPDHVLHIKPSPLVLTAAPEGANAEQLAADVQAYAEGYGAYFQRNQAQTSGLKELDRCPRWAIWPGAGTLSISGSTKGLRIVDDIVSHTRRCLQWGEALGGWRPVSETSLFEVEYWELEQAKLKVIGGSKPSLQGKIAVVTGAASGIGRAIAEQLGAAGAAVAALDRSPQVVAQFESDHTLGVVCDVTSEASVVEALERVAHHFGGMDILVTNAGTFPPGQPVAELSEAHWTSVLDVNLSGHFRVIKAAIPLLMLGFLPSIVVMGSKNVPAPGPGASAYSTAKAGLTQLARVSALELAPFGIRVNTVHPDAVFDTGLWSDDVLAQRAAHYGLTVDQYKRKNLLKTEITSKDVSALVLAMVGPAFAKTTGAQIPVDGGNDRVI
jgi:rhamnose utilization protein RhaD (predicted bifunctional aldolase and dehydrogenase)/NAD(P)-dependent dehydrogenase (short-subunit alcohol dehydrogenase family)